MKKQATRHMQHAMLGTGCLAVVLCVGMMCVQQADAEKAIKYEVNEAGLTYGSLADAVSVDTEPDLIQATATNGANSYIKKTELDAASEIASCPEEAVAIMEKRHATQKAAFYEALNAGKKAMVSRAESDELFEKIDQSESGAAGAVSASVKSKLGANEAQLDDAYWKAREATSTSIPVYEVDGETVIGEFVVM